MRKHGYRWADVPGVSYPALAAQKRAAPWGQDTLPDPQAWMDTHAAAAALHLTEGGTRQKLFKLRVPCLRARGMCFWCRREVEALAGNTRFLATTPPGWLLEDATRRRLGCSRSQLYRYTAKGRLHSSHALVGGKRRVLYLASDVEALATLLEQARQIDTSLQAWR